GDKRIEEMGFVQETSTFAAERTMLNVGRPASVRHRAKRLSADGQVTGNLEDLLPVFVLEGFGGENAGSKSEQSGPGSRPPILIQRARKDLLADAFRIPWHLLPSRGEIDREEFLVFLEHEFAFKVGI